MPWKCTGERRYTYEIEARLKDYLEKGEQYPWDTFKEFPTLGEAEDELAYLPHSPFVEYKIVEVVRQPMEEPAAELPRHEGAHVFDAE
jgi:hypothetical protein